MSIEEKNSLEFYKYHLFAILKDDYTYKTWYVDFDKDFYQYLHIRDNSRISYDKRDSFKKHVYRFFLILHQCFSINVTSKSNQF